jgi:hypothetical protein
VCWTSRSASQSPHCRSEDTSHVPSYSSQSGDHSAIHPRSPVISKTLRTITPGLVSTSSPFPSARIRFLATTRPEMPLCCEATGAKLSAAREQCPALVSDSLIVVGSSLERVSPGRDLRRSGSLNGLYPVGRCNRHIEQAALLVVLAHGPCCYATALPRPGASGSHQPGYEGFVHVGEV